MTTDKPLPITCYIRTLNEERRIGDVVARAARLCDQVVLVDSGSTDATIEIATSLGAEVVDQEWLGFGRQKRVGEDLARNDWLLDLDADEVMSTALVDEIAEEFSGEGPTQNVYKLPLTIVDPTGRRWVHSGVAFRAKLYDRRRVRIPDDVAADQLDLTPDLRVARLSTPLWHHAFTDLGQLVVKQMSARRQLLDGVRPKPKSEVCLRVLCGMPFYFLRYYALRGLWRVGLYGFSFSVVCAFSCWIRDVKLYERDCITLDAASSTPPPSTNHADRASSESATHSSRRAA